ncbi:glycosyltransferase [Fibrobacter sp.]
MKIILVVDRIVTGGAERILVDYYHYLEKEGHTPYVFALSGNAAQSKWTEGLRVTYGAPSDENNLIKKTFQQISLLFKLRKLIGKVNPDGIFSFLEKSNLLTILVPAKNAKKVVSVHNVLSIQYQKIRNKCVRKILYRMIRMAYNHCPNVVVVSKQVKDDLIENFGVKVGNITVINNYVDKENILEKSNELIDNFSFDPKKKYILNVGRFSVQKAQWKLIKAFSLYLNSVKMDEVELILMGAGEFTDELENLTKKLGVAAKVHILPFNTNPYKYMAKAHLFVLSSIYEGFPIVLAEISSLRIPFVGSRKAIPEEMFDDAQIWEGCVYETTSSTIDFTSKLHEDEFALAVLLKKAIEDNSYRIMLLEHLEKWESSNFKVCQFRKYDAILNVNNRV